jgi:two-component system NarL family sensor kinase
VLGGVEVSVETTDLPPLLAAVEVAAYRIALEAITSVTRHAAASKCLVRLALNGQLELEIADDDCGLNGAPRHGLGFFSMRERAGLNADEYQQWIADFYQRIFARPA